MGDIGIDRQSVGYDKVEKLIILIKFLLCACYL